MSTTLITSRDTKGLHAVGLFEAGYNKAKLDDARAQRLNERGGEFQDGVLKLIVELTASDRYIDEEVQSNYTYPYEYSGPKPIAEQINRLAEIFGLDPNHVLEFANNLPVLSSFVPEDALPWVGWFAIPTVDALATRFFPEVTAPAERYCCAVQTVLKKLGASRPFHNYRDGQIIPERLRLHARTVHALDLVAQSQAGDILVIAIQLGMRHRGRSIRRAREVFTVNEFGLDSVAGGCITLTHPERFVRCEELDMDLPGGEFDDPGAALRFSHAPCFCFYFGGSRLEFDAGAVDSRSGRFGSASGFLPQ